MSDKPQADYAEAHEAASRAFRALSPAQMRQRLRDAGVLGVAPQIGDKIRVLGRLNTWRYGVVVGTDPLGRVSVVRNAGDAVAVQPLQDFAEGHRVQLVARPSEGQEYAVAARAVELIGQCVDLADFSMQPPFGNGIDASGSRSLVALLASLGLAASALVLADDEAWTEETGRYRDCRARMAMG